MRNIHKKSVAWLLALLMILTQLPVGAWAETTDDDRVVDYSEPVQLPWTRSKPAVPYLMADTPLGMVVYSAVQGTYLPMGEKPTLTALADTAAAQAAADAKAAEDPSRAWRVVSAFTLGLSEEGWVQDGTLRVNLSFSQPTDLKPEESLSLVRLSDGQAVTANFTARQASLQGVLFSTDALGDYAILGASVPEPVQYTVTFVADGAALESRAVNAGDPVGAFPEAPAREGWTFVAWQGEEGAAVDETTPVTGDMTIAAVYTQDYPATTADAATDTVNVHVEVPEGALPADARFRMTAVSGEDYRAAVETALGGTVGQIQAVDMSFVGLDGTEYQPLKPVTVNVTVTGMADAETLSVVHIAHNGQAEIVYTGAPETVKMRGGEDRKTFSFEADGFSVYAVVDDSTGDEARMTLQFWNGDTQIASMIVKNGDDPEHLEYIVYDPGTGTVAQNELFKGWIVGEVNNGKPTYTEADAANAKNIEQIREWVLQQNIKEGDIVDIVAMIYRTFAVTYKDESNVAVHSVALITMDSSGSIAYTVNQEYTPKSQDAAFDGWYWNSPTDNAVTMPDGTSIDQTTPITNGTQVLIKGNVTFMADPPEGHWLIFKENETTGTSHASYTPPQFIPTDDLPTEPTPPSRHGYDFGGWYTDEACTTPFNFNQKLTARTTVYAKWTEAQKANYTVLIWKQNLAGDGYDFVESITLEGYVGREINTVTQQGTGTDAYARVNGDNKQYPGFHLKEITYDPSDKKIAPEGTSVVHVRYDRNDVTFNFYVFNPSGGYQQTNGSDVYGAYYGRFSDNGYPNSNGNSFRRVYLLTNGGWGYPTDGTRSYGVYKYNENGPYLATYSGNRYRQNGNWRLYTTTTGRFETLLSENGFTWPTAYNWYDYSGEGGGAGGTRTTFLDAYLPSNPNDTTVNFYGQPVVGNIQVRFYKQDPDNPDQYDLANTVTASPGTFYISDKYHGFEAYQYRVNGGAWQSVGTKDGEGIYNGGVGVDYTTGLDIRFNRLKYSLLYFDGVYVDGDGIIQDEANRGELSHVYDIVYGSNISSYNKGGANYYEPTMDGYVFGGWYLDNACTQPYTFTTMPEGITVYAKWIKKQYRVMLHPNVPTADTSLDWGGQSMSFRVDYNEMIAGGNKIIGKRDDYEFIGWYMDEDCTKPFNMEAYSLNDDTVTAAYDQTEPNDLDKYGNPVTTVNSDAENNRYWITRKLDLYGKWRAKIEGANGIKVRYQAGAGHWEDGKTEADDPITYYLDSAEASAMGAPIPNDDTKQFMHWVVQSWDETQQTFVDTETIVYPGDLVTVLKSHARQLQLEQQTEDGQTYEYIFQLRAVYDNREERTPTHIWWFPNYGSNQAVKYDDNLHINQAVNIYQALSRNGYNFLGWARVSNETTHSQPGNPPTGDVLENLTKNDLYLKYENGQYILNDPVNPYNGNPVTHVAADERLDYHDMYAVWEPKKYTVTVVKVTEVAYENEPFKFTPSFTYKNAALPETADNKYNTDFYLVGNTSGATVSGTAYTNTKVFTEVPFGTTLRLNETATYYDMDVKYSVTGADEASKNVTNQGTSNNTSLTVDGNMTVTYTNTRQKGGIKVVKHFDVQELYLDGTALDEYRKNLTITITGPVQPDGKAYSKTLHLTPDFTFDNQHTYTWETSRDAVAAGVYHVQESGQENLLPGYFLKTSSTTPSGDQVSQTDITVTKGNLGEGTTLKNYYHGDKGTLKVTKTVSGLSTEDATANADKLYKYIIKNTDLGAKGEDNQPTGVYVQDNDLKHFTSDRNQAYQFTIKAGATNTYQLPIGHYTIEEIGTEEDGEAWITDYTLDTENSSLTSSVNVTKASEVTAQLVNKYVRDTGNLTINKTVDGDHAEGKFPYSVKVQFGTNKWLKGTGTTADPYTLTSTEADAAIYTIPRTDNTRTGTVTLTGVPTGTYTVIEQGTEESGSAQITDYELAVTYDPTNATVKKGETGNVGITNTYTRKAVVLTVTKTVDGNGAETDKPFTFTMRVADAEDGAAYPYTKGSETGTISDGTFTLKHGESIKITVPVSKLITLTESDNDNYTVTWTDAAADSENASKATVTLTNDQTVAVKNTRKTGGLTINKTVDDQSDAPETNKTFAFTVTLSEPLPAPASVTPSSDNVAVTVSEDRKTLTFGLGNNDQVALTGLPVGCGYTVKETSDPAYTTTAAQVNPEATGTAAEDGSVTITGTVTDAENGATVTYTNTRKVGTLTLKKKAVDQTGADIAAAASHGYTFIIKKGETQYGEPVTVQGGETKTIENVPYGTYTVTEDTGTNNDKVALTGYRYESNNVSQPATLDAEHPTAEVTITNTYTKLVPVTVTKTFSGIEQSDIPTDFNFAVAFTYTETGKAAVTKDLTLQPAEEGSNIEFSGTWPNFTWTISGIPVGATAKVSEQNYTVTGYKVTPTIPDAITVAQSGENKLAITNTYELGELTITKTFTGAELTAEQKNGVTFTVNGPGEYSETFTYAQMTQGSMTLTGLKLGEYTVTEDNNEFTGYKLIVTGNPADGKVTLADTNDGTMKQTVAFTNKYEQGSLIIKKTWVGDDIGDTEKKKLSITITGKDVNPDSTADKNSLTITYADFINGSYTINKLPAGEKYTVTETNADQLNAAQYTFVAADSTITVENVEVKTDNTAEAELKNKYQRKTQDVTVTKTFSGLNSKDHIPSSFTISYTSNEDQAGAAARQLVLTNLTPTEDGTDVTYTWTIEAAKVGETLTFTESKYTNDWYSVTTNANGTANAVSGTLTVKEIKTGETDTNKFSFTNTYTRKKASLTITKTWAGDDDIGEDAKKALSITVAGTDVNPSAADETGKKTLTVTLDAFTKNTDGTYTYTISNLPVGEPYTVTETNAGDLNPFYTLVEADSTTFGTVNSLAEAGSTVALTNKYEVKKVKVTATKVWKDNGDTSQRKPVTLTLSGTAGGAAVALTDNVKTIAVNAEPKTATWENLPAAQNGTEITWTVTETAIEGYTKSGDGAANKGDDGNWTITITNTRTGTTTFTGTKVWVDGGKTHTNASEITLTLSRISTKPNAVAETVVAEPAWTGNSFAYSELDQFDADGYPYTYSVTETQVTGYDAPTYTNGSTQVTDKALNNGTITNTLTQDQVTVTGTKTWTDPGTLTHNNASEITLTLKRTSTKLNSTAETVTATVAWSGDTYTFTGLDMYDTERYFYNYDVEEAAITNYVTTSTDAVYDKNTKTWTKNFTNTRDVGSLKVSKSVTVNGQTTTTALMDGTYSFTVKSDAGVTPATEKTVTITFANGQATGYTIDGGSTMADTTGIVTLSNLPTGAYTVTENLTAAQKADGITVNAATSSVTVVKDGTVPTASFVNNKNVGNLKLTKTVTGTDNKTDEFTFSVTLTAPTNITLASSYPTVTPAGTPGTQAVTSGTAFNVTLSAGQSFVIKDLPEGTTYIIAETTMPVGYTNTTKSGENGTIAMDTTKEASFTNVYSEAKVAPQVTKALTGRNWLDSDSFTFSLAAADDTEAAITAGKVIMPDSLTAVATRTKQTAAFGEITFKAAGIYDFTITEQNAGTTSNGITYSQKQVDVKVVVTNINGTLSTKTTYAELKKDDGTAVVNPVYAEAPQTVTNTYAATGTVTFTGTKTIVNRQFKSGDTLDVTVTADNGVKLPDPATIASVPLTAGQTTADFTFATITYDQDDLAKGDGTYETKIFTYTFTETAHMEGTAADAKTHTVSVTVTDNGAGLLTATPTYSDGEKVQFTNTYNTSATATISGTKALETWLNGVKAETSLKSLEANQFSFNIVANDPTTAPMPTSVQTSNSANGTFSFAEITYPLSLLINADGTIETTKTFTYTVAENQMGVDTTTHVKGDITYSQDTYDVKVTLTYDPATGVLSASVDKTADDVKFTNKYETVSVSLTKSWVDQSNKYGLRPTAADFGDMLTLSGKTDTEESGTTVTVGESITRTIVSTNDENKPLDNWTITYTNLPKYRNGKVIVYSVEEDEIAGYTTIGSPASNGGTITNTLKTGKITVEKKVESDAANDHTKEFTFKVTLNGHLDINATTTGENGMTFENGVATFVLKDGESKTGLELPVGWTYTVAEQPTTTGGTTVDGFTTTHQTTGEQAASNGLTTEAITIIADETGTSTLFTNTRETGSLTVKKVVSSVSEDDEDREFEFTVELNDKTIGKPTDEAPNGKTYNAVKTTGTGEEQKSEDTTVTFKDGVATIKLKHKEQITINGLPTDVTYTVTETALKLNDIEAFTTKNKTDNGEEVAGLKTGDITITTTGTTTTFTNTRKTATVKVIKRVTGNMGDRQRAFVFNLTVDDSIQSAGDDADDDGSGMMLFDDGGLDEDANNEVNANGVSFTYEGDSDPVGFILKHDWYVTVVNLPVGANISITEDSTEYYTSYKPGDAETSEGGKHSQTATFILDEGGNTVTFFNDKTIQIDTGIRDDVSPYLFLLGLIPLAGVGLFLGQRRRRRMIAG